MSSRPLTENEITQLTAQGCSALGDAWHGVTVRDPFRADRVTHVRFEGEVQIGVLEEDSAAGRSELRQARLVNCRIGDHFRIVHVGVAIENYDIGDHVAIENVGRIVATRDSQFGNGVEVSVLNEGGGREVVLFNGLTCQIATMLCLYRYRPALVDRLKTLSHEAALKAHVGRGSIGRGASIRSVVAIENVHVGAAAQLDGCARLENGSILSHPQAVTRVGAAVQAREFIIAEGAQVDSGVLLDKTYVGQACRLGKQFSAENCLFFANCEAFHGEACSVFAGPYTVTHHKSTLLIAGLFSFYNAGSGSNQSNHMYKLGPVHEGRLERGCKTGSFSYLMWPCRVGPFSVVLGKHGRVFDTGSLPFSHLEAGSDGRCFLVPGLNLTTVGTIRDGDKWPTRDRRYPPLASDLIHFDVFSPFTVGRMIQGCELLRQTEQRTDRSVETVVLGGADVKRVLLRSGQKNYRRAIEMYLTTRVVTQVKEGIAQGKSWRDSLRCDEDAIPGQAWVDLGGQLMPSERLTQIEEKLVSGEVADLESLHSALQAIAAAYRRDEWAWVRQAVHATLQLDLGRASAAQLHALADTFALRRREFLEMVLVDASKEFESTSRLGFGSDGPASAVESDFQAVRGTYDGNRFVTGIRKELAEIDPLVNQWKQTVMD